MAEIIQKDLIPAVCTYMEQIAHTASLKKAVVPDISVSGEAELLKKLTALSENMMTELSALKSDTARAQETADLLESARMYQKTVLTDMDKLRSFADEAETLLPETVLPYPAYGKLLFSV